MSIWYRRIISLVIAYLIQRVLFVGFNFSAITNVDIFTAFTAFMDGIRFDLCVIATVNLPLICLHSLRGVPVPAKFIKWFDNIIGCLFILLNIPLIVFGVVDSRLFAFTGRRISMEIFDIGTDIKDQSLGIMIQYWYLTLPSIVAIALFAAFCWQKNHEVEKFTPKIVKQRIPQAALMASLGFLIVRGGWQTKPLAPAHAFSWQPVALANMVLNSGMTVLRTPSANAPHRYHDFPSEAQMAQLLAPHSSMQPPTAPAKGKNVVVFIVESLASEYCGFLNNGKGYTPFIDSLAASSVYFTDSFANGRRSIDAMPAIFSGIPAWRDQPFITSPYASNETSALPKVLGDLGYKTMFFHGASNGSMHFDVFANLAGFQEYIGKNEYPNSNDHDGHWGIFDEPFLQFAAKKFGETKAPFLAGIFTLTSHNPFKIPEKYLGKFPVGTLPIHQAIGYADFALEQFFRVSASQPWFGNTIFIITGDHTSLSDNPKYDNFAGRFRVPIIFYDPSRNLPTHSTKKVASHIDIKPTIMDILGIDRSKFGLFGGSLFDPSWEGRFVQTVWETWYYRDTSLQITVSGGDQASAFDVNDDHLAHPRSISDAADPKLLILKAYRQYFNNGLIDNTWYPKTSF